MTAVTISPVAVTFDVEASFQGYGGGIYSGTDCGTSINHASGFISLTPQYNKYKSSSPLMILDLSYIVCCLCPPCFTLLHPSCLPQW